MRVRNSNSLARGIAPYQLVSLVNLDAFLVCVFDVLLARHGLVGHSERDIYPLFYTFLQHRELLLEGLWVTCQVQLQGA